MPRVRIPPHPPASVLTRWSRSGRGGACAGSRLLPVSAGPETASLTTASTATQLIDTKKQNEKSGRPRNSPAVAAGWRSDACYDPRPGPPWCQFSRTGPPIVSYRVLSGTAVCRPRAGLRSIALPEMASHRRDSAASDDWSSVSPTWSDGRDVGRENIAHAANRLDQLGSVDVGLDFLA